LSNRRRRLYRDVQFAHDDRRIPISQDIETRGNSMLMRILSGLPHGAVEQKHLIHDTGRISHRLSQNAILGLPAVG
jgi:hypothetical protein